MTDEKKEDIQNQPLPSKKEAIPMSRLIVYLLVSATLPLFFIVLHYVTTKEKQNSLLEQLKTLQTSIHTQNLKEGQSKLVRQEFQEKDHFYLQKINTLTLLENEISSLQKALQGSFHPEEEAMRRRLSYLTGPDNTLSFTESAEKAYCGLKETQVQLSHPVDVNMSDVKKILSLIEGVQIDTFSPPSTRPQLIITDFHLEKKKGILNESYQLQLKLVKREYSK
jgi:hypothetical protein